MWNATTLIRELAKLIAEHGDKETLAHDKWGAINEVDEVCYDKEQDKFIIR